MHIVIRHTIYATIYNKKILDRYVKPPKENLMVLKIVGES